MTERDHYPHLSDSQFYTLGRMLNVFGQAALESLLTHDPDVHAQRIGAFMAHERALIDEVAKTTTASLTNAEPAEREDLRRQMKFEHEEIFERMRQRHNADMSRPREDKLKPVKLDVSLFKGKDLAMVSRG